MKKVQRRSFLRGLGGATLALPFLPSLATNSVVRAAPGAGPPKRFVTIKSYSTQVIRAFYPSSPVAGYEVRPYGDAGKDDGTTILTRELAESSGRHADGTEYFGKWAPLTDFSEGGVSRVLGTGLNPFLEKMLLLRGLDFMPDTNHNPAGMLGNFGDGLGPPPDTRRNVTIDQVLAHSRKVYPSVPSGPRILHLSPGKTNTISFAPQDLDDILGGPVEQAQGHVDPRTAFEEAFRGFMGTDSSTGPHPNTRLVDRVIEDYRRVRDHRRLSAEDRQTLERHMTFMSELQARLERHSGDGSLMACNDPTAPPSSTVGETRATDVTAIRRTYELMTDVLVASLLCDVTRVVTLNVFKAIGITAGEEEGFFHSCDPCALSGPTNWHTLAHDWEDTTARETIVTINEWIATQVVTPILQRLEEVTEADGSTVLDNSVVLWGNELGFNHINYSVPTVMWGSAGGCLNTGRYIDYIDWNQPVRFSQHDGMVIEGVPYNRLLVTLLQAFGLEPAEYEREPGASFGETRTLGKDPASFATDYDSSTLDKVLPDIGA